MGLDVGVPIEDLAYVGASMILDVDSMKVSTARVFSDVWLGEMWDLGAEYLKAEPALLMSRQSVLSVFGTSGYQEIGGTIGLRPVKLLRLTGGAHLQFYEETLPGARLDAGLRFATSPLPQATVLSLGYARVDAVELGYHSGKVAAMQPLPHNMTATLQGYAYFYDKEIEGYKRSLTGSLSLSYPFARQWELLWAGMMSRSPYASVDASTQLRVTYQFTASDRGASW
jgi:hypothetical protein